MRVVCCSLLSFYALALFAGCSPEAPQKPSAGQAPACEGKCDSLLGDAPRDQPQERWEFGPISLWLR